MFTERWINLHKDERGITGLETAIILIAFVVVAAVFAYTVLSAGMFASQESQEAIYSGLEEAESSLKINGGLVATGNATASAIDQMTFTISTALKGEAIDFTPPSNNVVVISYHDNYQVINDCNFTVAQLPGSDSDYLLEDGEKFQVTITGLEAGLNPDLGVNQEFSIEVKPAIGAVLTMERTTPATINTAMNLH